MQDDGIDPFTGLKRARQAGRLDESFLDADGRFVVEAWNRVRGERIDIANPSSMAALYGVTESYLVRSIRPKLDFVRREGPLWLSCVSSLSADAAHRRAYAKERQRQAGREYGANNLIRRQDGLIATGLQAEVGPAVWKVSSGQT